MFDRYVASQETSDVKRKSLMFTGAVVLHVLVGIAVLVYSFWHVEKVPVASAEISFVGASAPPPPPPPPPPPAKKKSASTEKKEKKEPQQTKEKELVQPDEEKVEEPEEEDPGAEEGGVEGGVAGGEQGGVLGGVIGGVQGGVVGGVVGGQVGGEGQFVPQALLKGNRISGENPRLSDSVKAIMVGQNTRRHTVAAKICVSATGVPTKVTMQKRSRFEEVNQTVLREMRNWKFRPYKVNGKPVAFCTFYTFNYQLK